MRAQKALIAPAIAAAILILVAPAALDAQLPDFSGTWSLTLEATLPGQQPTAGQAAEAGPGLQERGVLVEDCIYSGTVNLSQDGNTVSGPVVLGLVSGPDACPGEMTGNLTGTLTGGDQVGTFQIDGTISRTDDPQDPDGQATFTGTLSPNPGGSGTMNVSSGTFSGSRGSWMAQLQESVLEVPELTPVGMTVLTLLLLAAGAWVLSRQTAA